MPPLLSAADLDQFRTHGFLIVDRLFDPALARRALEDDVAPHVDACVRAQCARRRASRNVGGERSQTTADEGLLVALDHDEEESALLQRPILTRLSAAERLMPGTATVVHKTAWAGPALRRIWGHPAVVAAATALLAVCSDAAAAGGPSSSSSGVAAAAHPAFNLRPKVPLSASARGVEATVPWHQDAAYVMTAADVRRHGLQPGVTTTPAEDDDGGEDTSPPLSAPERDDGAAAPSAASSPCDGACCVPQLTMWVPLVDMVALSAAESGGEESSADGVLAGPLEVRSWPLLHRHRRETNKDSPSTPSTTILQHVGCDDGTWYLSIPNPNDGADGAPPSTLEMSETAATSVVCGRVPMGGAVFFSSWTPHRALPNLLAKTQATRWTADMRFQPAGATFSTGCECEALPLAPSGGGGDHDDAGATIDWELLPCCRRVDVEEEAVAALPQQQQRSAVQQGSGGKSGADEAAAAAAPPSFLDPVIGGPWMDAWPVRTVTRHVAAYREGRVAFPQPRYAAGGGASS